MESDSYIITKPEYTQRKTAFRNVEASGRVVAHRSALARPQKEAPDPGLIARPRQDRPTPESAHGEAGTTSTVHPSGREVGQDAWSGNPTPEKQ